MPPNFFHLKLSQFQAANGIAANAKIDGTQAKKKKKRQSTSIKLMAVRLFPFDFLFVP